ncbi:Ribonuclease H1 [Strongyloides ratti]|uniref:ribonuclease H n=1 Tax=Strongyloides ratti TaxID=34506 RepID=A0A090MW20_STRRB|nr:Ribonuclease H1 [Strongyloides ratti]CEF63328.1 Ribonuclease H1 [Strongyloides ratti]
MNYQGRKPKNLFLFDGKHRVVYTDGSCINNGRFDARAGIGVYWGEGNNLNISERYDGKQSSQAAELGAAIKALKIAEKKGFFDLILYTDSDYLYKSMTQWIYRWMKNGWRDVRNRPLSNKDLFEELYNLIEKTGTNIRKIPAHSKIDGNERADSLSRRGARQDYPSVKL